jgi:hypothetical protein
MSRRLDSTRSGDNPSDLSVQIAASFMKCLAVRRHEIQRTRPLAQIAMIPIGMDSLLPSSVTIVPARPHRTNTVNSAAFAVVALVLGDVVLGCRRSLVRALAGPFDLAHARSSVARSQLWAVSSSGVSGRSQRTHEADWRRRSALRARPPARRARPRIKTAGRSYCRPTSTCSGCSSRLYSRSGGIGADCSRS